MKYEATTSILITRHRRQFSCKFEDRSQLFAYRYEWFRKEKKKKKSEKQLLSSTQKETKGAWLRRNLINDSDNGYERSTRRSMRNDPISIAITQANYPSHRSGGRLPGARRTRSARLDDWTESFEGILGFRILYFGISACQLLTLYLLITGSATN